MEPLRPADPQTIGRYRLSGRLGSGGMGEVFFGHSPGGRAVAVKVVRAELGSDEGFRRRFAREAEAARRVGGFHTAQVVDIDLDADPPWLVTAYVPGPSLAAVVAEHGALPEHSLRVLGAGLAEALEAIHAAGLVHRDLKPSNIIMAPDGPRVIDFGIAQADEGTALTRTGGSVGTPGFMAPEHITGADVGPPADVFALGAVLCHAAGVRPFGEGPAHTLMYRIVHGEPTLTGLPPAIHDIAASCLAKDPAARPTPPEILERLTTEATPDQWLPPEVTQMVSHHQETPPPPRRSPWPIWAGAATAALLVTLITGAFLIHDPSTPAAAPTKSATPTASAPAAHCTHATRRVTDPTGRSFDTWSCQTARPGPLYQEPTSGPTTGYLRSTSNWFVCQRQGSTDPATAWLYTQGDDRYQNEGWGWFPATSVSPTWTTPPIPDLPTCPF
ncbi:serine/threonine-protein kinase [Actinomadura sp. NEAU-AAG7]|uniref:serine/threonine-protein kinase n=1 Tax=Actinomadura sp. NEAU-AAG7 TaxID=2839640 RepID=UPI001BE41849|nr:serine/threonine-protein kinase [Actinomadura sp. NEAU-AAG7]MBT2211540.1 serine/threonine protein kinase [Actinomadura sp. NEAU-AAG7]